MPNRSAMTKAYKAVQNFIFDQKNGIGSSRFVEYVHSIGGGVQGDALRTYQPTPGVKRCIVKSRTFSDLSTAAEHYIAGLQLPGSKTAAFLVRLFGWNASSVESSKSLPAPEIIMQTANVSDYTDIAGRPDLVKDDGIIYAKSSLAWKLLSDNQPSLGKKYFIGIPEGHNENLRDPSHLINKINEMLETA
ncbi:hypothetical protein SCG7086_AB_00380 [Chlamydiales bacterium SCGC AG-110-P3]|nr:hypothetical protein SCG7086_AB_00380 [Chlamydiales bacterium SCGC AG-110-P3]